MRTDSPARLPDPTSHSYTCEEKRKVYDYKSVFLFFFLLLFHFVSFFFFFGMFLFPSLLVVLLFPFLFLSFFLSSFLSFFLSFFVACLLSCFFFLIFFSSLFRIFVFCYLSLSLPTQRYLTDIMYVKVLKKNAAKIMQQRLVSYFIERKKKSEK